MKRTILITVALAAAGALAQDKQVDPVRIPAVIDLKNKTCPIRGNAVDGETHLDWHGIRVHFCCPGCDKKFQADPAAALAKLGVKVAKDEGGTPFVDLANAKCPVRGGPAKEDVWTLHAGVRVHYCCPGCEKKLEAAPAKAFAALGYGYVPSVVDLRNTTCPVSGKPVDAETHADFDGIRVHFCCPGCEGKFGKDPVAGFKALGVDPERVKTGTK